MEPLNKLNEADKKFEYEVIKRRESVENIVLLLSVIFVINSIVSYILLEKSWFDDFLKNCTKMNFYSFIYIENVVFGILMVYLFNKYKF